jgi:hypothetical protein
MKHYVIGYLKKTLRFVTSFLPVARTRRGGCAGCGACCKLPSRCLFLRDRTDGSSYCTIYRVRPLNCRKYPRTRAEWLTARTCGFTFDDPDPH